jgi:hypothetical protein
LLVSWYAEFSVTIHCYYHVRALRTQLLVWTCAVENCFWNSVAEESASFDARLLAGFEVVLVFVVGHSRGVNRGRAIH